MAVLFDTCEKDDPADLPMSLSIRWQGIWVEWHGDIETQVEIGLFLGDKPLFSDAAYDHPRGYDADWLRPGCFAGENSNCSILFELWKVLTTGERVDFEDDIDPAFRMVIAPDLFQSEPRGSEECDYYDILAIIERGGPWHGSAVGMSGPAVLMGAKRRDLERFFYDLLDEALDPKISDEGSRLKLQGWFAPALERRSFQPLSK